MPLRLGYGDCTSVRQVRSEGRCYAGFCLPAENCMPLARMCTAKAEYTYRCYTSTSACLPAKDSKNLMDVLMVYRFTDEPMACELSHFDDQALAHQITYEAGFLLVLLMASPSMKDCLCL